MCLHVFILRQTLFNFVCVSYEQLSKGIGDLRKEQGRMMKDYIV